MSTQRKPEYIDDAINDEAVHAFLESNPDFFERHSELLSALRLPHVAGGTVSLVERQVSVLRQKDLKLERQLKELLDVARANDLLGDKIHKLALALLTAKNLTSTLTICERTLRVDFDANQAVLVLFRDPVHFEDIDVGRFFHPLPRQSESLGSFETFLKRSNPRCGQIRDSQRDFLFGQETDEIGSCALVPLGAKSELGFLAIGSADAERFHPGMSIDFLTRLGQLIAAALQRY
jgi:uncharacterized protein YigA (DUF484 family)